MESIVVLTQDQFNALNEKLEFILSKISLPANNQEQLWISNKEAMKLLNIGQTTLWSYRNKGILKAKKINKKLYFYKPDIHDLLKSL